MSKTYQCFDGENNFRGLNYPTEKQATDTAEIIIGKTWPELQEVGWTVRPYDDDGAVDLGRGVMEVNKLIEIDYINWRGERAWRKVIPFSLVFASNEWHPQEQWLMRAWDFERRVWRDYALSGIYGTRTTQEKP